MADQATISSDGYDLSLAQLDEIHQLRCDLAKMTNERDLLVGDAQLMRDLKREIKGHNTTIQVRFGGYAGAGNSKLLKLGRLWRQVQMGADQG